MSKIMVVCLSHYLNGGGIWHEWVVLAVGCSPYAGSFPIAESFNDSASALAYAADLEQQLKANEANNIVSLSKAGC